MRVLLLSLAVLPPTIFAADTCFTAGELASVIFISIFGAFVICVGAGLIIWFLIRKFEKAKKKSIFEKAHATQVTDSSVSDADVEKRGMVNDGFEKQVTVRDQETEADLPTLLPQHEIHGEVETSPKNNYFHSLDNPQSEEEKRRHAQQLALKHFGFTIDGNKDDGIFIDRVIPGTPAEKSGNIFVGDKIKTLTISFENMRFDDSLAVLALVTDYTVRLDLERVTQLAEMTQTEGGVVTGLIRLPGSLKSASSGNVNQLLQKHFDRQCKSAEILEAPALTSQQQDQLKNVPLPSCECSMEEERIIKIVRHPKKRLDSVQESLTKSKEPSTPTKDNDALLELTSIQASDFDCRMKTLIKMETTTMRVCPTLMDASSDSGESSAGSINEEFSESVDDVVNKGRTVIISSETMVDVNSNTRVSQEAVATLQPTVPLPENQLFKAIPSPKIIKQSPSPVPPLSPELNKTSIAVHPDEITSISFTESEPITIAESILENQFESSTPSITSSISPVVSEFSSSPSVTPMESPTVEVSPSINPTVTTSVSEKLTADFVEVRTQKFPKSEAECDIVDRKLPSLPDSVAKQASVSKKTDAGQMYLNVRSKLKEVYTSTGDEVCSDSQKPVLSETQFNTLEANRQKLEHEQQQLKELGIL